jgi:pimeloyl-ACP methyl ester carboxylesterase
MAYFTNTDGVRFYYQDHGPADGPAVLLVSSWSLDSTMWEYQVPALVAAGYRCVAMDRRGHGRSDEPGVGYDLDTLADDLARLVDHLGLTELAVVAHSMGCCETVRALHRYGTAGVRRAVLACTVSPHVASAVGAEAYAAALAELQADRPAWFAIRRDGYFALPHSEASAAQADDAIAGALRVPMEVLLACQRAGTATDVAADLAALDVPTLFLHGDADQSAPLEITGKPSAELVPGAELVVYPGGPHGLYVSHRERFTGDLLRFLAA